MAKRARAPRAIDIEARPEDERLPVGKTFAFGLQHVLTMYGGIIAPPLIIGQAAHLDANAIALLITSCLFMGGLATLLQTMGVPFFGSKLPLVQGVSFAGVATMLAIVAGGGGLPATFGAVIAAAVIGIVLAPFFAKIIKFFPPVVTGVVITTIGLSLVPVAAGWTMGGVGSKDFGDPINLGLAGLTLAIIVVLTKVGSPTVSRLSILLAIVIATVFSALIGKADFSNVFNGPIVAIPQPFAFGPPVFEPAAIISMLIVILVTFTETTADILAVGEIVGTKVDSKRIAAGLRADMLSSAVSPVFNSFTQSAFAQNVGLVALTGIKTRFAVAAGGVVLVALGVLPVLGRVVADIPFGVLGGAGIVLFGTVAASGIKTLTKVDFKNNLNLIIVAVSITFGILPVVQPGIYDKFPAWFQVIFHSGISSATVMAILLNVIFNHLHGRSERSRSVFASAPARLVSEAEIAALEDGDSFVGGKLVAADGREVPIVTEEQAHLHRTSAVPINYLDEPKAHRRGRKRRGRKGDVVRGDGSPEGEPDRDAAELTTTE